MSNSIWSTMVSNSKLSNGKATSINPVVFAMSKSKCEELGLLDKEVNMQEIINLINSSNVKFIMPNVTQTNSGASIYLSFLNALCGNPEIMTIEQINQSSVKENLIKLFNNVSRSSGSEEYLKDMVLQGEYDCLVNYESVIIDLNKKLEVEDKEPLQIIYNLIINSLKQVKF